MHPVLYHLKGLGTALVGMLRRTPRLSDDAQWEQWKQDFDRIYQENLYVFRNRYIYRELLKIFENNDFLKKEGGYFFEWLKGHYGRDMVMAVGRELDRNTESINLIQLIYQMTQRPDVITRQRFLDIHQVKPGDPKAWPPDIDCFRYEQTQKWFTENVGSGNQLDPAVIKKDRNWLEKQCKSAMKYRHKMVAHRSDMQLTLTIKEIHDSLDAVEKILKKYYGIMTGNALMQATPTIQFYWTKVFTQPWIEK